MKNNWWLGCVLAGSLMPAAVHAGDKFDAMRERWAVKLVGSAAQDYSAPAVVQQLRAEADAAQRSLDSMSRDPDAKALWSDLAGFDDPYPIKASSTIDKTAARLEQMAKAYAAPGGPSWHDAKLGAGVAAGLDWLVRHYYTAGRHEFGNWWTWQIGTPLEVLNVLTLAGDAIPAALRKRTLDAVNWHVPDGRYKTLPDGTVDKKWAETGANLLDKSLVMVLSGVLGKDGGRIAAGRDGLAMTLDYATSGDGFYRDGSYIQHGYIAYNGGYGAVSLADYARFLYILGGSEWSLKDPRAPRIFQWALEGFAAPVIDGAMPDALRGRGVSRHGQTDHTIGRGMAASLAVIAEQAPPAERAVLRATIKGWMQRDRTFGADYLGGGKELAPYERGLLQQIAADPATPAAPEEQGARIYASMDRAILRGQGFAAVLSMASPRISSFEQGNSENLHGWWQGMGVLQLYDADQAQFDGDYWATIDPQRLPGTTTDHSAKGRPVDWKKYPNPETWVGGAALGKYAALGMAFSLRDVTGSNLHGRKAWFQLGDRVLALGSGIDGGEGEVETIVDNRRLLDPAGARLLVDGQPLANGSKDGARWAYLQDDKSGSRIGYVFPQGATLRTDRSERSGSWRDINTLSGPAGVVRQNYQLLSIPKTSSQYAYLVLPNASVEATRVAAGDPGLRIEANDEHAAAVSLPKQGVYAADLWQAGSAPRDGREYVWTSAPAAVVATVADGRLQLAIADPTQQAPVLEVRIAQAVAQVGKLGPGVTVLETSPQLHLRIDTAGTAGASFKAEFILPRLALAQDVAKAQHGAIGVVEDIALAPHTSHPDAQWFPQAGFGMFIHWGLSSVFDTRYQRVGDLSWAMIVGAWKNKTFTDPREQARIIREADWNFDGKPPSITPNKYWDAAKEFNPQNYDPDKWMAAAKAAGMTYVVLTTRHHEGFALWPSAYGGFDTKNYMGGRDLVRPFVEAARKYGLKVGLYYSPPNWHFDREYMNFMYYGTARMNPWLPELDADLKPRTVFKAAEERRRHLDEYNAIVKGQVEELLTRYGKIDLLWFDGSIPAPEGDAPRLTQARVRELQPGIVLSPRYFRDGDYATFEGPVLKTSEVQRKQWAEWCTTWADGWAYTRKPFYSTGFELANLALARSLNINLLLDVGPDANGELAPEAYTKLAEVSRWMKLNRAAVQAGALPESEKASVPATASGKQRFLFAVPAFTKAERAMDADLIAPTDTGLVLAGLAAAPAKVMLLGDGKPLPSVFDAGKLTVHLPAARRTKLPDVVAVQLR